MVRAPRDRRVQRDPRVAMTMMILEMTMTARVQKGRRVPKVVTMMSLKIENCDQIVPLISTLDSKGINMIDLFLFVSTLLNGMIDFLLQLGS